MSHRAEAVWAQPRGRYSTCPALSKISCEPPPPPPSSRGSSTSRRSFGRQCAGPVSGPGGRKARQLDDEQLGGVVVITCVRGRANRGTLSRLEPTFCARIRGLASL
eukprot:SAG11_NODE_2059_length_3874_cov_1.709139_2_plen_106_part_00